MPELAESADLGAHFELREVHIEEPGMSPREIWCNESQERYVLAIAPERLDDFRAICTRERCPFAVVGEATADGHLTVTDRQFDNTPVDMDMQVLLGKPPKMTRKVSRRAVHLPPFDVTDIDLADACRRVLRLPSVASKNFLITIGDRSVGGMTARDQMVGPWQVPVADVAVTSMGFQGYLGEAFAMGERTPLACFDAPASRTHGSRRGADQHRRGQHRRSRRRQAVGQLDGGGRLTGRGRATCSTRCARCPVLPAGIGVSIPVGQGFAVDANRMGRQTARQKQVISPLSLIVTAFAPVQDVRRTLTPQLQLPAGRRTDLLLIDLGDGNHRLGGSALAQVFNAVGEHAPDVDAERLRRFLRAIQRCRADNLLLAYHDRTDGGLFATVCEMAFAAHCGVSLDLDTLCYDRWMNDVNGLDKKPDTLKGRFFDKVFGGLFAEELGAVVQIRRADREKVIAPMRDAGLAYHFIGEPNDKDEIRVWRNAKLLFNAPRAELMQTWSETSYRIARLRDNATCAQEEFDALAEDDPGLSFELSFDPADDIAAPMIATGARPKVAILREQGVNSHVEMAAAFVRAGFDAFDVHMSDLQSGRHSLTDFKVLGGLRRLFLWRRARRRAGLGEVDPLQHRAARRFRGLLRARRYLRARRLQRLPDDGASGRDHPRRTTLADIPAQSQRAVRGALCSWWKSSNRRRCCSTAWPAAACRSSSSHGEGRAVFAEGAIDCRGAGCCAMSIHDGEGSRRPTRATPTARRTASPAVTTPDGRFTIMMPHPERGFRSTQMSWHPAAGARTSPWLRMFRNARRALG